MLSCLVVFCFSKLFVNFEGVKLGVFRYWFFVLNLGRVVKLLMVELLVIL